MRTLAILSLIGTVIVGALLRWGMAGAVSIGDFSSLRHLHTHLGYYGVLFPLMWLSWRALGAAAPGRVLGGIYAAAVAVSAVGFAREGYGLTAIIGSAVVLTVWLVSAWGIRARRGDWLSTVPLAIVIGASMVPLVSSSEGERASELVRSFLGTLMLGALIPTALASLKAPHFPRGSWLVLAVAGALSLGAVTWPALLAALLAVGVLMGVAAARSHAPADIKVAWIGLAAGMLAVGIGLLPLHHHVAVAGVHFAILGPLLLSLWPHRPPRALRLPYLLLVAAMCTAILLQSLAPHPLLPALTAITGSAIAAALIGWSALPWATRHILLWHSKHFPARGSDASRLHGQCPRK